MPSLTGCVHCVSMWGDRETDQPTTGCYLVVLGLLPPSFPSVSAQVWQTVGKRQRKSGRRKLQKNQKTKTQARCSLIIQHCFNLRLYICGYTPVDVQLQKSVRMFLHLFLP